MKQLGNLAIVCAKKKDTLFQILNGSVTVFLGAGPERRSITMEWHDDKSISELVYELNHGQFRETEAKKGAAAA